MNIKNKFHYCFPLQVQKATGLSFQIGSWGVPVLHFSRWDSSTQEPEQSIPQESEVIPAETVADSTQASPAPDAHASHGADSRAAVAPGEVVTANATTGTGSSRAEVERRLTQVTLEADR